MATQCDMRRDTGLPQGVDHFGKFTRHELKDQRKTDEIGFFGQHAGDQRLRIITECLDLGFVA